MARDPSASDLARILRLSKTAVLGSSWVARPQGTLELHSALMDDGIVLEGVSIFVRCHKNRPDEQVTVGLVIEGARKPYCLARIDWRASSGHPNTHVLCGAYRFLEAGRTHFHNPELIPHESDVLTHLQENLPIAVKIETSLRTFEDVLGCSSRLLNVENLEEVSTPPWQQQAF